MKEKIKKYIFYFFSFSFLGWVWEVLENLVVKQRLINCGTLRGPWVPIYGWVMIIIIFINKKVDKKKKIW